MLQFLGNAAVLREWHRFFGNNVIFQEWPCFSGEWVPFLWDQCCFSRNIPVFPGRLRGSPVIFGMPSRRGTGSRTMIPRSVPTQSEPWHSRRLVTRTSFCPATGKARKNRDQGESHGPTPSRPWGFRREWPREDTDTSTASGKCWG